MMAKEAKHAMLRHGKLDSSSLILKPFSDTTFERNDDISSQIGYILMLCDGLGHSHILDYSSKK